MKVYIAGPISGRPRDNREAFDGAEAYLEYRGHTPLSPFTIEAYSHSGVCPPGPRENSGHTAPCHLRTDIVGMLMCDAIYMLKGWESSAGARLELAVAAQCGLQVYVQDGGQL